MTVLYTNDYNGDSSDIVSGTVAFFNSFEAIRFDLNNLTAPVALSVTDAAGQLDLSVELDTVSAEIRVLADGLNLVTGQGNDTIVSSRTGLTLSGLGGNDAFNVGTDAGVVLGGEGSDTLILSSRDFGEISTSGVEHLHLASGEPASARAAQLEAFDTIRNVHTPSGFIEVFILDGGNLDLSDEAGDRRVKLIASNFGNTLVGGAGHDELIGREGHDVFFGGVGDDWLVGGSGRNTLEGGAGNDTIIGGPIDLEDGAAATDKLRGGDGNDMLSVDNGFADADGGAGSDRIFIGQFIDTGSLAGGTGVDTLAVLSQDLTGLTLSGLEILELRYELATASLAQATGSLAQFESFTTITSSPEATGRITLKVSGAGSADLSAELGSRAVLIQALGAGITVTAGSGRDSLMGGTGTDVLNGGAGADHLAGGVGNDTYVVATAGDTLVENASAGADLVRAGYNFTLGSNFEHLELTGTATLTGTGNAGANRITGNAAANTLKGLDGNDTLDGAAGNDVLQGGLGNDIYVFGAGDILTEGASAGTDLVKSSVSHTLLVNFEQLLLTGTGVINGSGNAASNALTGNVAANTLKGLDGNDRLNAGAGNDRLEGGAGADSLSGGNGLDRLYGGTGTDTLNGGAGADSFYFARGDGRDLVTSFADNADTLYVDDALWGGGAKTAAQILAYAKVVNGDTVFDFGNGNVLTIDNLTNKSALSDDLAWY